jgi:phosphopantothenoylcysteine decarboxylase/phosphopantothenate--cysteine ligase
MPELDGQHIVLGISGGIAAYKTPALVRLLRDQGAQVQVVLTASARHFVTPTVLQALSDRPVRSDLWDEAAEAAMGHIELARWADLVLIAPATADCLARLAAGRADDLLTTLCLATDAPVWVAPAMNQGMWRKPATARNLETLIGDGFRVIGPDDGAQACGDTGPGRMAEPDAIATVIAQATGTGAPGGCLAGVRVMVTAGPTREALDPVRYISNHSSGKQGYAIAASASALGAEVTLISGPTNLVPPPGVTCVAVESACDMLTAVEAGIADQQLFVGVAAVADYRPRTAAVQKMKKRGAPPEIVLEENPDIIATVAARTDRPVVVGFAAETEHALDHARDKRRRKKLDAIVVNDVSRHDIGFNSEHNAATLIWEEGEYNLAHQSKASLAVELLERIAQLFGDRLTARAPASVVRQRG